MLHIFIYKQHHIYITISYVSLSLYIFIILYIYKQYHIIVGLPFCWVIKETSLMLSGEAGSDPAERLRNAGAKGKFSGGLRGKCQGCRWPLDINVSTLW